LAGEVGKHGVEHRGLNGGGGIVIEIDAVHGDAFSIDTVLEGVNGCADVLESCTWGSASQEYQGGCVAYRDLREFVRKLEKEGELKRVQTEVDPVLEITEITQRVARDAQKTAIPQGLKPDREAAGYVGPKG